MKKNVRKRKQRTISIVLIVVACVLLASLGIYLWINKNADSQVVDNPSQVQKKAQEIKESADAVELTEQEMAEFTELFKTPEYKGFLTEAFSDPSKINWCEVLYNGGGIARDDMSGEEKAAFFKTAGVNDVDIDAEIIRKSDLEKYVNDHTGFGISDVEKNFSWPYVKEYDSYYFMHGAKNDVPCTCASGTTLGDSYVLNFTPDNQEEEFYAYTYEPDRELTIKKNGDTYLVLSDIFLWEVGNDPEQTFDVDLTWADNCRLITYQGDASTDKNAAALITSDGKRMAWLHSSLRTEKAGASDTYWDEMYIKKYDAFGIFDFNGDGLTDIVAVAEFEDGKTHPVIYEAVIDNYDIGYYLSVKDNTSLKIEEQLNGDITIPNIKKVLLGDSNSGEFSSWRDAYSHLIKVNHLEDDYLYSLVYLDGDDTPDLVEDYRGYWINVYCFKDGVAKPVMRNWSYGAAGNGGYEYSPKKSCIRFWTNAYAGAIHYLTYAQINADGTFSDYTCEMYEFDDLNDNGYPDDEETTTEALEKATGKVLYHSDVQGISDKEVESKINTYEDYSFEELSGTENYETFINTLKSAQ